MIVQVHTTAGAVRSHQPVDGSNEQGIVLVRQNASRFTQQHPLLPSSSIFLPVPAWTP